KAWRRMREEQLGLAIDRTPRARTEHVKMYVRRADGSAIFCQGQRRVAADVDVAAEADVAQRVDQADERGNVRLVGKRVHRQLHGLGSHRVPATYTRFAAPTPEVTICNV